MIPDRPLRIAQVVPPLESVPPAGYGGTERVVAALVRELALGGHEVTTFASGDSIVPGRLIPTLARALRPAGFGGDPTPFVMATLATVLRHEGEFDLIHAHLDASGPFLARAARTPVVTTFHGRLDQPWADAVLERPAGAMVAVSRSQAASRPGFPWTAVIHNGLHLGGAPFPMPIGDELCFVGRIAPEKGVVDAIEVARRTGRRLRIAAKTAFTATEQEYYREVFLPAMRRADVELLGEVTSEQRDRLMAASYATLVPSTWPEPFGLVAIESLACGTPVVARRRGALPEIVRQGRDGFLGDDVSALVAGVERVATLDRAAIRTSVLRRFSAARMTAAYLKVYRGLVGA